MQGVAALGLTDRESLYWAGRSTMVASRADLETYDEVFDEWYRSLREMHEPELSLAFDLPPDPEDFELPATSHRPPIAAGVSTAASWQHAGEDDEHDRGRRGGAAAGRLGRRDPALEVLRVPERGGTPAGRQDDSASSPIQVPIERTRRMRAANKGTTLDMRRTLRRSLRTQGEPFERAWRAAPDADAGRSC